MNAEYLEVCRSKAFLPSKDSEQTEENSKMKVKLETGDCDGKQGPLLGQDDASQALKAKGFQDGKPLGAMQIILNDDLGLHHSMLHKKKFDGGWKAAYRQSGQMTKYGHLILAGTIENFQEWAKSTPCREEVKDVEHGRLFAYIEHQEGDTNPGQGYVVSVRASAGRASATIEEAVVYIIHHNGDVYHGELSKGLKHGHGCYIYASGTTYVGQWKEDNKHGQGTYTYSDGGKYVGEWQNGKKHGQGSSTYASGNSYVGEWRDGKRHGQGSLTFPDGEKYVGEFKDGKKHGQGRYNYAGGDIYVGQWKDNKKHGQGCFSWTNGSSWTGPYIEDKAHGVGILTFKDGSVNDKFEMENDAPKKK